MSRLFVLRIQSSRDAAPEGAALLLVCFVEPLGESLFHRDAKSVVLAVKSCSDLNNGYGNLVNLPIDAHRVSEVAIISNAPRFNGNLLTFYAEGRLSCAFHLFSPVLFYRLQDKLLHTPTGYTTPKGYLIEKKSGVFFDGFDEIRAPVELLSHVEQGADSGLLAFDLELPEANPTIVGGLLLGQVVFAP
tara:strand:- start:66 stop:632 length:567 start_codon:yes stop_codon:yes gene_type:complete